MIPVPSRDRNLLPISLFRSRERISQAVRLELAATLFDHLVPMTIMTAIFVVVGAMIVRSTRDPWLAGLFVLATIATVSRLLIVIRYRARKAASPIGEADIGAWERAFASTSFVFAACFGMFAARATASGSSLDHELVLALLFGYGSGVVACLSLRPWVSLPCLALACAPSVVVLLMSGRLEATILGVMVAVFALGSTETTRYLYRTACEQVSMRRHLAGVARQDPLTGLANRLLLEECAAAELARAGRDGQSVVGLLYVDLDGFKGVNDTLGHPAGDAVLRAVAARLSGLLRAGDVAARIGGDEFVIMQAARPHGGEAELLAARIVWALRLPFAIDGREVRIGASVGVATAPADGTTTEALLERADAALYRAKLRGRNTFAVAAATDAAPEALAS